MKRLAQVLSIAGAILSSGYCIIGFGGWLVHLTAAQLRDLALNMTVPVLGLVLAALGLYLELRAKRTDSLDNKKETSK